MQNTYYTNVRSDVLNLVPNRVVHKAMEIGGGEFPTLLAINRDKDAELWGVDIYPCTNPLIHFVHGSIESVNVQEKIPDDYFDLILANDVLEHLVDTEAFLEFCHKKLATNGCLILSVPNIRQIRALYHIFIMGTFPRQASGLFDRTHLRWFCKRDLVDLFNNNGFCIQDIHAVGKLVPNFLKRSRLAEFLALQHIFLLYKRVE